MSQMPIVGESYTLLAPQFSSQTCKNWYPSTGHFLKEGKSTLNSQSPLSYQFAKSSSNLLPTDGSVLFSSNAGRSVRGLITANQYTFAIIDNGFYTINQISGAATLLGTLNTSFGLCDMIANPLQIMITDQTYGYVYNYKLGTFVQITSAVFTVAGKLSYQDGYGIYIQTNTSNWWISNLNDFTGWSPIFEASTINRADNLNGVVSLHLQLFLMGTARTEVWTNTGNIPFPFTRNSATLIHAGCAATYSISVMDNTAYFVSQDETGNLAVSKFNGYAVTPVSTEAIEDILDQAAAAGNISNAFAFSYGRNGHLFYVLQLPSLNRTMVYDTVSTLWHERTSQIAPLYDTSGRWLANCYTFFNGQHYIGDYQSGNIYRLSNTAYTDNGQPIIRERTTSILSNPDGLRMFISRFQIDADVGEGLPTGQGSVPTIRIQISKNGGRTFDSVVEIPMGQIGQYLTRVKVNRVGYGRSFVFRITFSDPCFCSIFNGIIDSEAGDS